MPTTPELFSLAMAHQQAGRWEAAEQACQQILTIDPRCADALHLLGVIASQSGRPAAGVEWISRAISIKDTDAVFHSNLGAIYNDLGRHDEGIRSCRRALKLNPSHAAAHYNLGNALLAKGKLTDSIHAFRSALESKPDFIDAYNNLGTALLAQGALDEAVACCQRALALQGNNPLAHYNLGLAWQASGKLDLAIASFERTVELSPEFAQAHFNLANALQSQGNNSDAVAHYQAAISLNSDHFHSYNNLGTALQAEGQFKEAVVCFRRALELAPNQPEAYSNLGNVLRSFGKFTEAVVCYRRAAELNPSDPVIQYNLSGAYQSLGELDHAIACCHRALELKPEFAHAHNNLGAALSDQRQQDEAIVEFRKALELKPDFDEAWSNYLFALQYREGANLAELSVAHSDYDRVMAAPLSSVWRPHECSRDANRPLRLGFVSPDFGLSPVGFFLIGALEHLDRDQCEVHCYNTRTLSDELSTRFRTTTQTWSDAAQLSDEEFCERVRADHIDILFDMAGHTVHNRLRVFARKPAPIQISWAGYAATTGMNTMDYILADRWEIPPESDEYYRERVLRMPDGYVCFEPPTYAPAVSPLPAQSQGFVTFGCFNNPPKITDRIVDVWAQILRRVPQSRLVLKYRRMNYHTTANRIAAQFISHGIDPQRVECLGGSPPREFLEEYERIDIALDPFPYNGGLTTCEALWMGVPVVTCPGETFASRHSLSHLSNVGLTETIARDLDHYVELAVALATDVPRLATLRATLRQRMAASPLCDAKRFAQNLTAILRQAWHAWCDA